jgi:glycerate kinase
MKVLLAPDKFKGSLTAAEVVQHLGHGLAERGIGYRGLPLADGGDGSVEAAIAAGFRPIRITVADATGHERPTIAAFDGRTAVVEVANTCGLQTLPGGTLAPLEATSRGVGQAITSVLALGATRIVLALGGSASTDGGAGMLAALGVRFLDDAGLPIVMNGGTLGRIRSIDAGDLPDLSGVEIVIASDVQNPLTGPDGAAAVYGPQKGATTAALVDILDAGLVHLVHQLTQGGYQDADRYAATPGAGAAGGLGFAGLLLGGRVVSGADYFLDLLGFEKHLQGCDLVITGEGRMDDQTLNGKLPAIIAQRAGRVPVIAVVGRSDITPEALRRMGIDAVHAIVDHTDRNPAGDPALTKDLLEQLGRTIPLPR